MNTAKVINYIVKWLKDYCDKARLKGFVVGVSGGIDSAVTSTVCAKTGHRVFVFSMPIYQEKTQSSLAEKHINWLCRKFSNIQSFTIDLTPSFNMIQKNFPEDIQDELTMANTRSRIRMLTLYAFAGHYKMIVTGTGNKVEDFGVGFFTKYGDGGVDISPIADLMKSEVYQVGREMGILEDILKASPTDGLWADNRTDENQIGASYDELEWAMKFEGVDEDENQLNQRQKEVLTIYRKFHQANKHKMEPVPILKIPGDLKY